MSDLSNKIVFFAEVSEGMKKYKENLKKELEHHGCRIEEATISDLENEHIREIMEQCDASVHILSDHDFDYNPSGKGIEELQINYSVQHFVGNRLLTDQLENSFKIYAWHLRSRAGNMYAEEHLSNHLKKIQQLDEVDFVRSNFEDFKYYLLRQIQNSVSDDSDDFYIKGNRNFKIYFLYDLSDKEEAEQYVGYLKQRGFKVFTPEFNSDIISSRKMHENNLKRFDIALIYAANASVNWINMKVMDILKSPGLGREKEILGKAILTIHSNVNSFPLVQRGFEVVPIEPETIKSQIDHILQKLIP